MKTKALIFLALPIICISCYKPFVCEGTVYSKHGNRLPNVKVTLQVYQTSSSYWDYQLSDTTDSNGNFQFRADVRRRDRLELDCQSDSGKAKIAVNRKGMNNILLQ